LRMYEESIIPKKHTRKQEDRIKRMATKLLRLCSDKTRKEKEGKGGVSVETQEKYEEFNANIRELKQTGTEQKKILETQELVPDLKKECQVLREANQNLVSSAFDQDRERAAEKIVVTILMKKEGRYVRKQEWEINGSVHQDARGLKGRAARCVWGKTRRTVVYVAGW
jgi:protein fantom